MWDGPWGSSSSPEFLTFSTNSSCCGALRVHIFSWRYWEDIAFYLVPLRLLRHTRLPTFQADVPRHPCNYNNSVRFATKPRRLILCNNGR